MPAVMAHEEASDAETSPTKTSSATMCSKANWCWQYLDELAVTQAESVVLLTQASKLRIARERGLKVGGLGQGLCTSMHSGQKGMMRNGGAPITRVFSFGFD